MVVIYSTLIIRGYKTFEQVPVKLQSQVKEYLNNLGLNENGKELEGDV